MKKLLVKHNNEIIAQTQGTDDELAVWLEGDKFKYPEGYVVEYIDMTEEVKARKVREKNKDEVREKLKLVDFDKITNTKQLKEVVADILEIIK